MQVGTKRVESFSELAYDLRAAVLRDGAERIRTLGSFYSIFR